MTKKTDAWKAAHEGREVGGAGPLFDPIPPPPTKGLDGMLTQHERDHAAALGVPPAVLDAAPPPSTAAQETAARERTFPNEAADPWARARAGNAPTPVERGTAGSEAAGSKWTKAEKQAIDSAIGILAAAEVPFTSDEVWALAPGVPVSKGIGARLRLAARRGLIRNTGEHRTSTRGGKHDHAQTLTVWIGGRP